MKLVGTRNENLMCSSKGGARKKEPSSRRGHFVFHSLATRDEREQLKISAAEIAFTRNGNFSRTIICKIDCLMFKKSLLNTSGGMAEISFTEFSNFFNEKFLRFLKALKKFRKKGSARIAKFSILINIFLKINFIQFFN